MPASERYADDKWMQDFREFFSMFTSWRKISLNIMDAKRALTLGAVLVDKDTAHITYLEVPVQEQPRRSYPLVQSYFAVENPLLPHVYFRAQMSRDLFVEMLHVVITHATVCPYPSRMKGVNLFAQND